jgi:hypothetical protein
MAKLRWLKVSLGGMLNGGSMLCRRINCWDLPWTVRQPLTGSEMA